MDTLLRMLAVIGLLLSLPTAVQAAPAHQAPDTASPPRARLPASSTGPVTRTPQEALDLLVQGNRRFAEGKALGPHRDQARLLATAAKQQPFAIIVGCSDSRVPNEIIFDQGIGDLFIVRTAGQVGASSTFASIEFAEEILGAKLIVVLGHTQCGAVKAALERPAVPGHIPTLINAIRPAAERAKPAAKESQLDASIRENVRQQVEDLKQLEPVLSKRVQDGTVKIVGAVYDLATGRISFLP